MINTETQSEPYLTFHIFGRKILRDFVAITKTDHTNSSAYLGFKSSRRSWMWGPDELPTDSKVNFVN